MAKALAVHTKSIRHSTKRETELLLAGPPLKLAETISVGVTLKSSEHQGDGVKGIAVPEELRLGNTMSRA